MFFLLKAEVEGITLCLPVGAAWWMWAAQIGAESLLPYKFDFTVCAIKNKGTCDGWRVPGDEGGYSAATLKHWSQGDMFSLGIN